MDFSAILTSSWAAFKADPLLFTTGILVTWPLVWGSAYLVYQATLMSKDDRIAGLKERLETYEKRLGNTPDEAKARLDALERNANWTIGPAWRPLRQLEIARLKENLGKLPKSRIQIMYSNHLGAPLAGEFAEIFRDLGWTIGSLGEGSSLGFGISTGRGSGGAIALKKVIEASTDFLVSSFGPDEVDTPGFVFLSVGVNANEDGSAPRKGQN
jgi:hypothetical protein